MDGLVRKSLNTPEETRPFEGDMGQLELVNTKSGVVGRATFKPGWKWSEHVKPIAKTDSCQAPHTGYFISGRMIVVMDEVNGWSTALATSCQQLPGITHGSSVTSRVSSSTGRVLPTTPSDKGDAAVLAVSEWPTWGWT
jgi:hypothetical protein